MRQTVERLANVSRPRPRPSEQADSQSPISDTPPAATPVQRSGPQRVNDAIVEAQQRGEFDNLRGKGKPIPAELLVAGDDAWLAGKVLANAGFLPPWLQLQQEIDDDLAECRRLIERTERFPPLTNRELPLQTLRARLDDVRTKARRYNLMAPTMALQRPLPETSDLLLRMERAVNQTPN